MSATLYVFNSGSRNKYLENALATLSLPEDADNEYRYRWRGDRVNVSSKTATACESLPAGTPVVIVFIDRYTGPEYTYFPIRHGELIHARKDGDTLICRVRLKSIVWPHSPAVISARLFHALSPKGSPKARPNPGGVEGAAYDDGNYLILAGSIEANTALYLSAEDAWDAAARFLGSLPAFCGEKDSTLFTRLRIVRAGMREALSVTIRADQTWSYPLVRGAHYELHVRYWFPAAANDPSAVAAIRISASPGIDSLDPSDIPLDSALDTIVHRLVVTRLIDGTDGFLSVSFSSAGPLALRASARNIPVTIVRSGSQIAQILLAALLFVVGSIGSKGVGQPGIFSAASWVIAGIILQFVGLLLLFRLFGKKFV